MYTEGTMRFIYEASIAILGQGVTAQHVQETALRLGIAVVAPDDADLIIASPGIPPDQYPVVKGVIISEIEWAYRLFQASGNMPTLIAVTGTNGKSTVTSLIASICDIPAAGNIGAPLS